MWETSVKSCGPDPPEWETSVGDKRKIMRPRAFRVATKCGRQVGHTCQTTRPRAPRLGDKWETSVKPCCAEHPEWERSVKSCGPDHPESGRHAGDKRETSVESCDPKHPAWETSAGDNVGDKCKIMWPRAPRLGDGRQVLHHAARNAQSGRQVGDKCKIMRPRPPRLGDNVGDKCKIMWPRAPRVGDKCGRQVLNHAAQNEDKRWATV